jgi:hypothetical protein
MHFIFQLDSAMMALYFTFEQAHILVPAEAAVPQSLFEPFFDRDEDTTTLS